MDKVVLVSFRFEEGAGGGAVAVVQDLVRGLRQRNLQVVVITTHPNSKLSVEQHANLVIYRFLPFNLYWVGSKSYQASWKKVFWQLMDIWNLHTYRIVRSILAKEKPGIVHVHKLRGLSPAVWTAARHEGISALVHTCHDYELISPQGTLSGKIGALVHRRSLLIHPYLQLRRKFSEVVASATAPSQYTLDMHISRGFFNNSYHTVVPNTHGFSLSVLDSMRKNGTDLSKKSNANKPINVLFMGRLEEIKGIQTLCHAFVQVSLHYPNLYLHIAGTGPEESGLIKKYASHPRLTFHGHVHGEVKSQLIRYCDVMIMPSTSPEVFGLVLAEAYAYSKPVIASRIGGIPEIVAEGKTGFLIEPGNFAALVEILSRVAEHIDEFHQMAPACFESARRFTTEGLIDGYLSVYKAALSRNEDRI